MPPPPQTPALAPPRLQDSPQVRCPDPSLCSCWNRSGSPPKVSSARHAIVHRRRSPGLPDPGSPSQDRCEWICGALKPGAPLHRPCPRAPLHCRHRTSTPTLCASRVLRSRPLVSISTPLNLLRSLFWPVAHSRCPGIARQQAMVTSAALHRCTPRRNPHATRGTPERVCHGAYSVPDPFSLANRA